MDSSDFVDADGTVWRIFAGLPADYPATDTSTAAGPRRDGLTFRASTGEVRVLPQAAIPRRVQLPSLSARLGTRTPVARVEFPNWQELLRAALPWPPA